MALYPVSIINKNILVGQPLKLNGGKEASLEP